MIPATEQRTVTTGVVAAKAAFGISTKDTAHIMGILRDGLYTNRILAVLREYASNAWDAHRQIGKGDVPIAITLPTPLDLTLVIRDFGPGLSHEDVFAVYTQYGASTKRDSDNVVGMLGIGSKSGFAYSDSFTITSHHSGTQRTYIAVIDASEKGEIQLVHEAPTDETGIEIRLAIRPEDVGEFTSTAQQLFQHFDPRPTINTTLPPPVHDRVRLTHGAMWLARQDRYYPNGAIARQWTAIMGCVPYRINLAQVNVEQVGKFLHNTGGQLFFDIGDVQISASREELKYSTATKAKLVEKFNALVDEFVTHTLAAVDSGAYPPWEQRLRIQVLNDMHLPLPKVWTSMGASYAKLTYASEDFTLLHNRSACTNITVDTATRLLIDDCGRDLAGYEFRQYEYVVRPGEGRTLDAMRTALTAALAASDLLGIPIVDLSTLPWTAPYVPPKKQANPKHRATMFKFEPGAHTMFAAPYSRFWAIAKRVPQPTDVYVITENFLVDGRKDFFTTYENAIAALASLGIPPPVVYGYKHTAKRPVDPTTVVGVPFGTWCAQTLEAAITPVHRVLFELRVWAEHSPRFDVPDHEDLQHVQAVLGAAHPLAQFTEKLMLSHAMVAKLTGNQRRVLQRLAALIGWRSSTDPAEQQAALRARYPLLQDVTNLWSGDADAWLDYIQMYDRALASMALPSSMPTSAAPILSNP